MNKSIYQITNENQLLINQIIELDGEITPELEIALNINKGELETKGVNYAFIIKEIRDRKLVRKNYLDKLKKDNDIDDKIEQDLINRLSLGMQLCDTEKIETPFIKINFRNSESVEITNESQLDACFIVTKTVTSPDKKAIKDAIKNGEIVTGATISYNKNLQIK
jgi:hypothetical protein